MNNDKRCRVEGIMFMMAFTLTIPVANWMIGHVGTVLASGVAFLRSELADLAVYTPLARRRLIFGLEAAWGHSP